MGIIVNKYRNFAGVLALLLALWACFYAAPAFADEGAENANAQAPQASEPAPASTSAAASGSEPVLVYEFEPESAGEPKPVPAGEPESVSEGEPEFVLASEPGPASEAVEVRVGEEGMSVRLDVTSVKEGEPTLFAAEVEGVDSTAGLRYTWEESEDMNNWTTIANGSSPTLEVPTTPDRMGHFFRVRVTAPDGESKLSNIEMLAALVSDGTVPDPESTPSDTNPSDNTDDTNSGGGAGPSDEPADALNPYYPDPTPDEPVKEGDTETKTVETSAPVAKSFGAPKSVAADKPAVRASAIPQTGDAATDVLAALGLLLACALVVLVAARRYSR